MGDDLESVEMREPSPGMTDPAVRSAATARRRLMLGAAAAVLPSVVTLPSGAQTAASSTSLRCWKAGLLDRYMGGDIRFARIPDGWLRKRVYSGMVVNSVFGARCTTWDQDNIVQASTVQTNVGHTSGQGRLREAAPGTRWAFDGPVLEGKSMTVGVDCEVYDVSATPDLYAMVYVNDTGSVYSLEPDEGLHPVRETCFASLIGSRGTTLG